MSLPSPAFLPLFFIAWWCFILYLISFFGGWRQLAGNYRQDGYFQGHTWRFQTISMRWWTGYGGCVHIGANRDGLRLSVSFLFRPGHPALFIPWKDITRHEVRYWGTQRLELHFAKGGSVPVRIKPDLEKLLEEYWGSGEGMGSGRLP